MSSTLSQKNLDQLPVSQSIASNKISIKYRSSSQSDKISIAPSTVKNHSKLPALFSVNEGWKEKESLKQMIAVAQDNRKNFIKILNQLDNEHSHIVSYILFLQASVDQNINFDERSIKYIQKLCDNEGNLNYKAVVKDMIILSQIDCTGSIILRWHIKQAMDPISEHDHDAMLVSHNDSQSRYDSYQSDTKSRAQSRASTTKTGSTRLTSSEACAALRKVSLIKPFKNDLVSKLINLNQVSASSKMLNLRKNDQHKIYLMANQMSMKSLHSKTRIQRYLRENNLQLQTLQQLQDCFLKCDKNRSGQISRKAFLLKLAKNNIKVPEHFLNNLMQDLQLQAEEWPNDETILVYQNLTEIIDIFQSCPSTMPQDRNKSTNFISSLERMPLVTVPEEFGRADELIQHAHFKIIEKFKGFRECFRKLDKDFSGSLNFREFVQGMNDLGFQISLTDYRLLFDKIDFDEAGEIDYFKFCLLDFDKAEIRDQLIHKHQLNKIKNTVEKEVYNKNEDNLNTHILLEENITKNRELDKFLDQVQYKGYASDFLNKKIMINAQHRGDRQSTDLPNGHQFGVKSSISKHKIDDILKHNFADDHPPEMLLTVEKKYKPSQLNCRLKPPKPTTASSLRKKKNALTANNTIRLPQLNRSASEQAVSKQNLDQLHLSNAKHKIKEEVESYWVEHYSNDESVLINEDQARLICKRILRKILQVSKFDEQLFVQAFAILKYDKITKSIGKYELISLIQNLSKISPACSTKGTSEISNGQLHRMASSQAIKQQSPNLKVLSDNLKIKAYAQKLLRQFEDTKQLFERHEAVQYVTQVFKLAGHYCDPSIIDRQVQNEQQNGKIKRDSLYNLVLTCLKPIRKSSLKCNSEKNFLQHHLDSQSQDRLLDQFWKEYDMKKLGVLDIIQAHKYVTRVLDKLKGQKNFVTSDFTQWFENQDVKKIGFLEKNQIQDYIRKKVKNPSAEQAVKLVSKDDMQKAIENIQKIIELNKNFKLDYLAASNHIRKIYNVFDFDQDGALDQVELNAMAENTTRLILTDDPSKNVTELKNEIRKQAGKPHQKQLKEITKLICKFYNIDLPDSSDKTGNLPSPLARKSATVGRQHLRQLLQQNKIPDLTNGKNQDQELLKFLKKIWQQYGIEGNGYIDKAEAKHFVNEYMKMKKGIDEPVPDNYFNIWFRSLDHDGDNKIDMIELAHGLTEFIRTIPQLGPRKREKVLGDTIETIKARAQLVTVNEIIQGR